MNLRQKGQKQKQSRNTVTGELNSVERDMEREGEGRSETEIQRDRDE